MEEVEDMVAWEAAATAVTVQEVTVVTVPVEEVEAMVAV